MKKIEKNVEDIVESLRYILEDEGYLLTYKNCFLDGSKNNKIRDTLLFFGDTEIGKWWKEQLIPVIILNVDEQDQNKSLNIEKLAKCEYYIEFYYRLKEECGEIGYYVCCPVGISNIHPEVIVISGQKNLNLSSAGNYYLNTF